MFMLTLGEMPEAKVLLAYALWKRGDQDDYSEAMTLATDAARDSSVAVIARRDAAEIALNIERDRSGPDAARRVLATVSDQMSEFRAEEWGVRLDLKRGASAEAAHNAQLLYERRTQWTPEERERLGQLLLECGQAQEAFDVLKDVAPRRSLTHSTVALIRAADATENLEFLVRLCEELADAGVDDPALIDAHAIALAKRGEVGRAIELTSQYLKTHDDPLLRLRLAQLGIAVGRAELAETDPQRLPQPVVGDSERAPMVVGALRFAGNHLGAMTFAYTNYRLNRGDANAWRSVIESFLPMAGEVPLEEPDEVELGAAVKYREGDGPWKWAVIEDNAPEATYSEFASTHPFAQAMLGKKVGDRFEVPRPNLPARTYEIGEIRSKYVYQYQQCLDAWERQFPDVPGPLMIEIPEDPLEIVETLRPLLEGRANKITNLLQFYQDTPACSLHMLSRAFGGTAYSAMFMLAHASDAEVRCSFEPETSIRTIVDDLQSAPSVVIHTGALATIALCGQLQLLQLLGKRIAVARGTLDELALHRREVDNRGHATIGLIAGKAVFNQVDPEAQSQYLARLDEIATWLRDEAEVFSEDDRTLLTEREWDVWATLGGGGAADSLHRCLRTKAVLWSDDATVAGFAIQRGATAAWTQLVGSWLFEQGLLSADSLYALSAKLAGWRFAPTRIVPTVYLAAAREAQWDTTAWPLPEHFRLIETNVWSTRTLVGLLLGIVKLVWQNAPAENAAAQLTVALLERTRKRSDGRQVLTAVVRAMPAVFGLDVLNLKRAGDVFEAWTRVAYGEW
jgi:hypothetical protein